MSSLQEKVAAAKQPVPVYTFQLPPGIANGIESIGIREITSREELRAAKRSGRDGVKLGYELAKQGLAEINGESVHEGDGSADKVWDAMGPKARSLVVAAFQKVNHPTDDDLEGFLESQTVKV